MCWGQFEMLKIVIKTKASEILHLYGNEKKMLLKLNKSMQKSAASLLNTVDYCPACGRTQLLVIPEHTSSEKPMV